MRKFLIAALVLLAVAVGGFYAVYDRGVYVDLHPSAAVTPQFRTQGQDFLRPDGAGGWESMTLRGVDVTASLPGAYATQFAPETEDYLRWFTAIGEMGANTVRVYTVMDDDFYEALYTYNTSGEAPLYLMQGILVSDAANQGAGDAYSDDFLGRLRQDGRDVVDIIHGRKVIMANEMRGSGQYHWNLSPWVVGYIVGQEWDSDTVAYTDHSVARSGDFAGTYFVTAPAATPFEALLAQVMDDMVGYESAKYKTQRPIAFINDPQNDPFQYDDIYAAQLGKVNRLDAEDVLPTDRVVGGYFAAYRLYDFCPDIVGCLAPAELTRLGAMVDGVDRDGVYGGYLELLAGYHTLPVVAAGYGFSTARGAVTMAREPLTEKEQGEALVAVYEDAMAAGWAGVCVSTWQDNWERRSWNTAFATVLSQNYLWHDLQSDGQNYGLMAFVPGGEEALCVVDGDPREWGEEDVTLRESGRTLSLRYDAEGVYLLVEGADVGPDEALYVPLDTTGESGSQRCQNPSLTFDRGVDFVLCLAGEEESRLLVQERYDALRENFLYALTGEDPFVTPPDREGATFVTVGMALANPTLISAEERDALSAEALRRKGALGRWETGRLVHGSGDADSPAYHSLADFCYGEGCVEVRLPWLLLNVADPTRMLVHGDYYDYYGVRTQSVDSLAVGLGTGEARIALVETPLAGVGAPETHERLKESYHMLRQAWRGGGEV